MYREPPACCGHDLDAHDSAGCLVVGCSCVIPGDAAISDLYRSERDRFRGVMPEQTLRIVTSIHRGSPRIDEHVRLRTYARDLRYLDLPEVMREERRRGQPVELTEPRPLWDEWQALTETDSEWKRPARARREVETREWLRRLERK